MKRLLRHFAVETFSLWLVSISAQGMIFEKGTASIVTAGIGLTIASLIAKPVINLLILPLNLITFGLFRWVSSAVVLYLVTLVVHEFKISYFSFLGLTSKWFDLPPIYFKGLMAFVGFAFLLSLFSSLIYWLIK